MPQHLIALMYNLNCGQKATVRIWRDDGFLQAKVSDKGAFLSSYLFNLYMEHTGKSGLDSKEEKLDDTILLAESSNDLK